MYETPGDLDWLQSIIDRSHREATAHLRAIWSDEYKIQADELPALLSGMQLLVLATVTARGEPRVGPVDGLFYRGRFWFGSSGRSARFAHIRRRPQVSATHIRGEDFAIVVHGAARTIDTSDPANADFVAYCREVYPHWDSFGPGEPYASIEPSKMFTFRKENRHP